MVPSSSRPEISEASDVLVSAEQLPRLNMVLALKDWIEAYGYQIIGPNREVYVRGPEANVAPEEYVTEIQFPVAKV